MDNIVDFDHLRNAQGEANLDEAIDNLKEDIYKGAYFLRKNDGKYYFGCTEINKTNQIKLLYRLQGVIQFYIDNFPDEEELEETAALVGKTKDEIMDEIYGENEETS